MDCDSLRDHLRAGTSPDDIALREHAKTCASCAELLADPHMIQLLCEAPVADELDQLKASIVESIGRERGTRAELRALRTGYRVMLLVLGVIVIAAVEATLLVRADLEAFPMPHMAAVLFGLAVLVAIGTVLLLRPLYRRQPNAGVLFGLSLLLLSVPVALSFIQPALDHPASLRGVGDELVPLALKCCAHGTVVASLVVVLLTALDRRLLAAPWAPLLAGSIGGAVGTLGLQLHCPIVAEEHWLLGHASVGFLVAGLFVLYRTIILPRPPDTAPPLRE